VQAGVVVVVVIQLRNPLQMEVPAAAEKVAATLLAK
jgi:hypothetical protein